MRRLPRTLMLLAVLASAAVAVTAGESTTAAGFTITATASPSSVGRGASVSITASVTSSSATRVLVDVEVFNAAGTKVFQKWWDTQALSAGVPKRYSTSWTVPTNEPLGTHTVKVGIFSPGWTSLLAWNDTATVFSVVSATPTPTPTPAPTPTPTSTTTFQTLPVGAVLPSGADCAARVRRSAWEPRPENATANTTKGISGVQINGGNSTAQTRFAPRVDGNFTGTTDEIIQWGACKWGLSEDIVRAVAVQESYWRQAGVGDSTGDATLCATMGKTAPCYQSYGLLQVKGSVHTGTYPIAERSTAFNVDYALAWRRSCYEGFFSHWVPAEAKGDEWGCVGLWFSGKWKDAGALDYISKVKTHLAGMVWTKSGF